MVSGTVANSYILKLRSLHDSLVPLLPVPRRVPADARRLLVVLSFSMAILQVRSLSLQGRRNAATAAYLTRALDPTIAKLLCMRSSANTDDVFNIAFSFLQFQLDAAFATEDRFMTYVTFGTSESSVGHCSTSRRHSSIHGFLLCQIDHHHDFNDVSTRTASRFCRENYRTLARRGTRPLVLLAFSFHDSRPRQIR
jgi:hypothetical protein